MWVVTLFACAIVLYLVVLAINTVKTACPPRISRDVQAFDNQFDVFRDMEPSSQVRENPWVGFLQEDLTRNRTGPIGTFVGNDSSSGNAVAYMIT
jgi:hypothetical protein